MRCTHTMGIQTTSNTHTHTHTHTHTTLRVHHSDRRMSDHPPSRQNADEIEIFSQSWGADVLFGRVWGHSTNHNPKSSIGSTHQTQHTHTQHTHRPRHVVRPTTDDDRRRRGRVGRVDVLTTTTHRDVVQRQHASHVTRHASRDCLVVVVVVRA